MTPKPVSISLIAARIEGPGGPEPVLLGGALVDRDQEGGHRGGAAGCRGREGELRASTAGPARRLPPPARSRRRRSWRLAALVGRWRPGASRAFGCGLGLGCGLGGFAGGSPAVGGAAASGAAAEAAAVGGGGGSGGACATAPWAAIAAPTTVAAIAVLTRPISRSTSATRQPFPVWLQGQPQLAGRLEPEQRDAGVDLLARLARRGRRSGPAPPGPRRPPAAAAGVVAERRGERPGRGLVEGLGRGSSTLPTS